MFTILHKNQQKKKINNKHYLAKYLLRALQRITRLGIIPYMHNKL